MKAKNLNPYPEIDLQDRASLAPGVSRVLIYFILLSWSASLSAQTLTGRVNNGTTGKPAAGELVELISLAQGTEEVAHTRTNASGHFSFHLPDSGPHMVSAIHQGVTYQSMVPAGTNSIEMQVFDVSSGTTNISVTADVMRFQAKGDELQGIRLFAVNNTSNPPRTLMHGRNFEFFLPAMARRSIRVWPRRMAARQSTLRSSKKIKTVTDSPSPFVLAKPSFKSSST